MDGYSAGHGFAIDGAGMVTMSRWKVVSILIGLAANSLCAHAQQTPAMPPFTLPDASSHRGVVDDTWIVAPKRLSDATLAAVKNYADEGDIAAGVSLRYRVDHAEWIAADVFVYPAGEGDPARMLRQASEDFRESVSYAERQSIYRNVWWGEEAAYTASLSGGRRLEGRFLPIVFDSQQDMLTSRTYLFYRKLYYVKIRLTTTVEAVDSLSENADQLVANIVDGLDIVSTGTCGKTMDIVAQSAGQPLPVELQDGVSMDGFRVALKTSSTGTPAYGTQMTRTLALAAKRQRAGGCTSLEYNPPLENDSRAVLHLSFGPADWGASQRPGDKP